MLATVRFLLVSIATLTACTAASAQLPIAPRPHPTIDQLAKDYKRLGLPLPPPEAELVRIEQIHRDYGENFNEPPRVSVSYLVGFKLPSTRPGKDPRYLVGDNAAWMGWIDPARVRHAKPTVDALNLVSMRSEFTLCLAAQCKLRGWHEFANDVYAYARASENKLLVEIQRPDEEWEIEELFPHFSWQGIEGQLTVPGTDRKEVLKRLKELAAEVPSVLIPHREERLRRLELTVAPRKSKPGTAEALIDDLTEYWRDSENPSNVKGQEAYWKLVELGFDAVPALIDHVNDDRLSRAYSEIQPCAWPYELTVGHLCRQLLSDLSARKIGGEFRTHRADPGDRDQIRKWFDAAKKIGEEKWLLDHAIANGEPGPIVNETGRPEGHIIRVIGAKYPDRLQAVYRAILRKKSSPYLAGYVPGILASNLTREQKLELLEEGAVNEDINHRINALDGLAAIDKAFFSKHLLKTLKEISGRLEKDEAWIQDIGSIVPLVLLTDGRDCWAELLTAAKLSSPADRMSVIRALDPQAPPDEVDPFRKERLRLLTRFLDDASIATGDVDHDQVRDHAAYYLAGLFRFPIERDPDRSAVLYRGDKGPLTRLHLREAVRQLAERELADVRK